MLDRSQTVRITGRSSSHFTRVVTMFAHELGVPYELVVVHDLTSLDPVEYGGHPALKLPTLHVGSSMLFGADNICCRLAALAGRASDPRVVLSHHVASDLVRSAQELVWHAMSAQVQLVVGTVLGKLPADNVYFAKARAGLLGALAWVESQLAATLEALPPRDVSVLEVTTFCLVEHVGFRPTVPLDPYPRLRDFATTFGARASAQRTPFRLDAPR